MADIFRFRVDVFALPTRLGASFFGAALGIEIPIARDFASRLGAPFGIERALTILFIFYFLP
jgi:hypothetical protein